METLRRWRADWTYPTTLLCVCGFFSSVKPLEPFLFPYLTGPDKNLTAEQVNNVILPVWTYSYLGVLVPVFLLTDWLRYKPVVVLLCVSVFATTAMLRWVEGVPAMQAMQFVYGVVTASEVAYFSYIYSMVELKRYRKATSYIRSVQLLGYTAGSVLGQLLVSFDLMTHSDILIFTLVLVAVALLASVLLPMPRWSVFFHRRDGHRAGTADGTGEAADDGTSDESPASQEEARDATVERGGEEREDGAGNGSLSNPVRGAESCGKVLLQLGRDFRQCYSSRELLYWSVWWALATCGYNQTVNYVQVLWDHVRPSQNSSIYNGGVEAASNLLGAATAYGIGFTEVRWEQWGELALGGFSGLGSAALFLMAFVSNIWVCYTAYAVFKCLYMLLITIAMFQIAVDLTIERYALVFGANTFGALALQTVLTSVVVDSGGLGLGIVTQFIIYASYFSVIAVVFSLRGLFTVWKTRSSNSSSYRLR